MRIINKYYQDINKCNTLDELFSIWKNKTLFFEKELSVGYDIKTFIADGIVDKVAWNDKSKKRILFILKEAYGDNWNEYTLATWLKTHPDCRIWNRISRWVYGIQNTNKLHVERYNPQINANTLPSPLDQIAVINIKKFNGESKSDDVNIEKYAENDKEEIKKEFYMIDADIIICGSTYKYLHDIVFEEEIREQKIIDKCDNWYYLININGKERLFLDYYHPANHWSDLMNYYGVVNIYQQALIEKEAKQYEK